MSIYVYKNLPAVDRLRSEGLDIREKETVFCSSNFQSSNVLKVLILNLMPTKIVTETQLLRLLGQSGFDIDVTFLRTATYTSRNTSEEHLDKFYHSFYEDIIKNSCFDGLIVTGAPVEQLDYEHVVYWEELCAIFDWAKTNVKSVFAICWGAQAALKFYYGIGKELMPKKLFGVFEHNILDDSHLLMKGLDKAFFVPHSRHTKVNEEEVNANKSLKVLVSSPLAGMHVIVSDDLRLVCVSGHSEYDRETLSLEYFRDVSRGEEISYPENYFVEGDPARLPEVFWRENGIKLMKNWLSFLKDGRAPAL